MRSQSRSKRMWGIAVAGLCVLWFATPADAVPLESWDNKIPNANARFKVLNEFNGAAVLDKETGLVWEKSPQTGTTSWGRARFDCLGKTTGNRKGWRLPSVHELWSLVDPSLAFPGPTIQPGHPFTNVQSDWYWSASTVADEATTAWGVPFHDGIVDITFLKTDPHPVWCVRGGQNHGDTY